MTLNIDFTPEQEARLAAAAQRQRLDPALLIQRLVTDHWPELETANPEPETSAPVIIDAKNASAIAYLERRIREEATDDPEEIRKADEEVEELKRNLNANRAATGERLVFR